MKRLAAIIVAAIAAASQAWGVGGGIGGGQLNSYVWTADPTVLYEPGLSQSGDGGTFNINPAGGMGGIYIGYTPFVTLLANFIATNSTGSGGVSTSGVQAVIAEWATTGTVASVLSESAARAAGDAALSNAIQTISLTPGLLNVVIAGVTGTLNSAGTTSTVVLTAANVGAVANTAAGIAAAGGLTNAAAFDAAGAATTVSNALNAAKVGTNVTISINGVAGMLSSNLSYTVAGISTSDVAAIAASVMSTGATLTASVVTGSQSNQISSALTNIPTLQQVTAAGNMANGDIIIPRRRSQQDQSLALGFEVNSQYGYVATNSIYFNYGGWSFSNKSDVESSLALGQFLEGSYPLDGSHLQGITASQVGADAAGAAAAVTTTSIGAVPTTRTITVNGTVGALTSNLSFTVAASGNAVTNGGATVNGNAVSNGAAITVTASLPAYVLTNAAAFDPAGAAATVQSNVTWNPITSSEATTTNYSQNGTNYTAYIFTNPASAASFSVPTNTAVGMLIVAGGGGGSFGGGGGGGVIATNVVLSGTYSVSVGAGGVGGWETVTNAANGSNSVVGSFVAFGGGYGGGIIDNLGDGGAGGSGGGGGHHQSPDGGGGNVSPANGGAATNGQGYAGGAGRLPNNWGGGGGGGATHVGYDATASTGGNGGDGFVSLISGVSKYYGAGGGGAYGGIGANGIGGNGASGPGMQSGTSGSVNTGAGGGGANRSAGNTLNFPGAGGRGIVIIRIATPIFGAGFNATGVAGNGQYLTGITAAQVGAVSTATFNSVESTNVLANQGILIPQILTTDTTNNLTICIGNLIGKAYQCYTATGAISLAVCPAWTSTYVSDFVTVALSLYGPTGIILPSYIKTNAGFTAYTTGATNLLLMTKSPYSPNILLGNLVMP